MHVLWLIPLFVVIVFADDNESPPIVEITLGKVEGKWDRSLNGREFSAFEGIPFALPPIGKYRFKDPEPIKHWQGTIKARTVYKCIQYNQYTLPGQDFVIGDEDCLYLNVYSPKLDPQANLDVIVYIHGGAFMFNYAAFQQPHYLLDRDVVMVTLNYRLGPLGFLSTESDYVPGNAGFKDQILALKWIQEHIRSFGGNPDSVTITGMSAGGASVHLHYLSPLSRGLFHKGISQSGTSLNPWVLMEKPLEKTKKLAAVVGCPQEHIKQMMACLSRRSARQLVEAVHEFLYWLYNPFSPFGIVIDTWSKQPVLPDHPYNLIKQKKFQDSPWILSYTSSEGLYPAADFYSDDYLKQINDRWNELMPYLLDYYYTVDSKEKQDLISGKVREFYLQDKVLSKETFMSLVQLIGDRMFVVDIEKTARLQAGLSKSPIYFYNFAHRGLHSRSEGRSGVTTNFGAAHADDTSYVYKTNLDVLSDKRDREVVGIMVEMFVSFAKNGKPRSSVEWPQLPRGINDALPILRIEGPDKITVEDKTILGNRDFWEGFDFKENEKFVGQRLKDEL